MLPALLAGGLAAGCQLAGQPADENPVAHPRLVADHHAMGARHHRMEAADSAMEAGHAAAPHLRTLQKALAADVTTRVHSAEATAAAIAASQVLFGGGDLTSLDEATLLDVFAGVPHLRVLRDEMTELTATAFLSDFTLHKIFPSKGEARKMIQAGGVSINREKVASPDAPVAALPHLAGKYLVVQKGKKNYFLVELV